MNPKPTTPAVAAQVSLIKEISTPRLKSRLLLKTIGLTVVNVVTIIFAIIILFQMPNKSSEIRELRKDQVLASLSADGEVLTQDIKRSQPQIDKLEEAISDEDGVLSFINVMDRLRVEGIITEFSFLRSEPVVDSTKQKGLPIQIIVEGNSEVIERAMGRINGLPKLVRPITVNMEYQNNEDGTIKLTYGGLLYVK